MKFLSILLFLLPFSAAAENADIVCRPVVTLASYHFDRDKDYNERNYGAGIECNQWQVGFYKNSQYETSQYVFYFPDSKFTAGTVDIGLMVGLVHGYDYTTILPVAAITVELGILRFAIIPPIKVDDDNIGVIGSQVIIPFQFGF